MHRTTRTALATAAVAAVLLGAGCTTPVPGLPAPAGAAPAAGTAVPTETDPVAWMNKVCTALLPALQVRATQPKIDPNNPADTISALKTYTAQAGPVIDTALNGMAAAGPSPIEGGDQAVSALSTTITAYRDALTQTKTKVDAIDPTNRRALVAAFPEAVAPLSDLSKLPNPAADLTESPALTQAVAQAPQCQQATSVAN